MCCGRGFLFGRGFRFGYVGVYVGLFHMITFYTHTHKQTNTTHKPSHTPSHTHKQTNTTHKPSHTQSQPPPNLPSSKLLFYDIPIRMEQAPSPVAPPFIPTPPSPIMSMPKLGCFGKSSKGCGKSGKSGGGSGKGGE